MHTINIKYCALLIVLCACPSSWAMGGEQNCTPFRPSDYFRRSDLERWIAFELDASCQHWSIWKLQISPATSLPIMLFVTLFKGSISRGPLDLKECLLLIGCCHVSSFVQNPLQFLKRWVCHFFLLKKLTFLKFVVGFLTFVLILVAGISKFRESHNKSQKCQFFEQEKVTNPPL